MAAFSERGMVKALGCPAASHFLVARDDRDGCSRYRAAEMSHYWDNQGGTAILQSPLFL